MASIITSLPDHVRDYIQEEVAAGRFDSEEAVIIRAVERQIDGGYRWEQDGQLLEAIAEYEQEGGKVWTPELRQRILEDARRGVERNDLVPYDLTY